MTVADIAAVKSEVLTCKQVAQILEADEQTLHHTAVHHPERLGFSVAVVGNRVKIPKLSFLRWMGVFEN